MREMHASQRGGTIRAVGDAELEQRREGSRAGVVLIWQWEALSDASTLLSPFPAPGH